MKITYLPYMGPPKDYYSNKIREEVVLDEKPKKNELKCPHCSKIGVAFAMKRWHFDNCKKKAANAD